MFSAIPYQEQIEVKHSNLCWLSILFYFLRYRSLFYIIYIIDVIYGCKHKSCNFMNFSCCLQKHWGKKPRKLRLSIFCDDVIMMLNFWNCFEVFFLPSIWAYSVKFGAHYTLWWKIVVPQSQNFSFFSFYFFYFLYFWKTADVSIFSF